MSMDSTFMFMAATADDKAAGVVDHASDPTIRLLAQCVASQQAAGFKTLIDIRQIPCPICKAPGFNDGWGAWIYTCGAEIVGGEISEPCGAGKVGAA